ERVTSNPNGWPYWWAFVIGLLQAQWTFTGYDASASVSEETVDPRRRAPWGILMAVLVSSVVGYLLLIALTLSIKDIGSVLNAKDASGNSVPAVIAILQSSLGQRAGAVFSGLAAMAMWFCGLAAVTWNSRQIYAFSRDQGLPASGLWMRVSRKHKTPAAAIWLCVIAAFAASIYSGAYAVVTSIGVLGLYLSYIIPVYLSWKLNKTGCAVEKGPWHLGRFGPAINFVAMLWVLFISVVLSVPDNLRPGKTIVGLLAILGIWYAVRERRRFAGPAWAAEKALASQAEAAIGTTRIEPE
ncbi:MAG: amino acid permease, partial [Blastocatellia bacterium]